MFCKRPAKIQFYIGVNLTVTVYSLILAINQRVNYKTINVKFVEFYIVYLTMTVYSFILELTKEPVSFRLGYPVSIL